LPTIVHGGLSASGAPGGINLEIVRVSLARRLLSPGAMKHAAQLFALVAVVIVAGSADAQVAAGSIDEQDLSNLINGARAAAGLQPFSLDPRLAAVSRGHSDEMARSWFFSHVSPTTGDVGARLRAARVPYRTASQSIAWVRSPRLAYDAFMSDAANRGNLLSPEFTDLGVGIVRVGREMLVTSTFVSALASRQWQTASPGAPWWTARRAAAALPAPWAPVTTALPAARVDPSNAAGHRWWSRRESQATEQCSLEGTWQGVVPDGMLRGNALSLVFRGDGTATGTAGSVRLDTRWVREGELVRINDTGAWPQLAACPAAQTGVYTLAFDSGCRSVRVVSSDDVCSHRNRTLQGLQASRVR
jgi:uncharacterized protein YkwD